VERVYLVHKDPRRVHLDLQEHLAILDLQVDLLGLRVILDLQEFKGLMDHRDHRVLTELLGLMDHRDHRDHRVV
jgi:hypothetical protein